MSALKAIRLKCRDCSNGSTKEIRLCPIGNCPLWPYRFGIRPRTALKKGYLQSAELVSCGRWFYAILTEGIFQLNKERRRQSI